MPLQQPEPTVKDVVDDINNHMRAAVEIDRAALLPGMFTAWCARLDLLDSDFSEKHTKLVLRARYGEGPCSELFVAGCAGTLKYTHLNERGKRFARSYYSRYPDDWRELFGENLYAVADSWETYQKIAAVLTEALLGKSGAPGAPGRTNGWWKFWK